MDYLLRIWTDDKDGKAHEHEVTFNKIMGSKTASLDTSSERAHELIS